MKSLCITGANDAELRLVYRLLQGAGMQPPMAAQRGEAISMESWHEQVTSAVVQDASGKRQPTAELGMLWERLASDLVLSNRAPLWGWADTRSTWLLDFWCKFDLQTNFVLVCVSPEQMLAGIIASDAETPPLDVFMSEWQNHHQALLRFAREHPQRSLLVDAYDCAANPGALIEQCAARWKLPLVSEAGGSTEPASQDPLVLYLARQLCRDYPQIADLQNEVSGAITRMTRLEVVAAPPGLRSWAARLFSRATPDKTISLYTPPPEDMIARFRELRGQSAQLKGEIAASGELRAAHTRLLEEAARRSQDQADAAALFSETETRLKQEYDALLLQLHQLQGEYEATLLKFEKGQTQIKALTDERTKQAAQLAERQKEAAALTQARDTQSKLATERQAKISELEQKLRVTQAKADEGATAADKLADAQKESELLLLQLHQVQEELEQYFLKGQEATAQCDGLKKEVATLTQARDAQTKLAVERQGQVAKLTQERDKLSAQLTERQKEVVTLAQARDAQTKQAADRLAQLTKTSADLSAASARAEAGAAAQVRLKEAEQEYELVVLQLRQVEEELERSAKEQQQQRENLKQFEARWQRMLQRNPRYSDYASVAIAPVKGETGALMWRFNNIDIGGRSLPTLEFKTIVEQGVAGLVFERQPNTSGPLMRWPASATSKNEVTILPAGTGELLQQRAQVLLDLAASDWEFVQALARLLVEMLGKPATLGLPPGFDGDALVDEINKLNAVIGKMPALLRYDKVSLKREQINPDYEHLWLQCETLTLGGQRWPAFEFRLSCANVRPGQFGAHPKLEFPEGAGQAPLKQWYAESYDDFGAKLELRIVLPDAMDMAVWQRLADQDRGFITGLIGRLPAMLDLLRMANVQSRRPWKDWRKMALDMQRVLKLRTSPALVPGSVAANQPAPATSVPNVPKVPSVVDSATNTTPNVLPLQARAARTESATPPKPQSKPKVAKAGTAEKNAKPSSAAKVQAPKRHEPKVSSVKARRAR